MEQAPVNQIALRFRMALQAMGHARGDVNVVRCLAQVTLPADFLREAGHGTIDVDILHRTADGLAHAATRQGEALLDNRQGAL